MSSAIAPAKSMMCRMRVVAEVGSGERRWVRGCRGLSRRRHLLDSGQPLSAHGEGRGLTV